jgi:uncharacterized repeat protein (TIGR01451 family)
LTRLGTAAGVALAAQAITLVATQGLPAALAVQSSKSPGSHHPQPSSPPVVHVPAISGLDISVTDGRTRVRPGDVLAYTVRVTDSGTGAARNLKITLMLPPYLRLASASGQHRFADGKVSWALTVRAGRTVSFDAKALLRKTPPGVGHLAVVACADSDGKPLVCAAHLDKLPGAAGSAQAGTARSAAKPGTVASVTSGDRSKYLIVGLAILVAALVAAITARVIRARHPRLVRHRHSG